MNHELKVFLDTWNNEAKKTTQLLRALPEGKYDFRPYPESRSLGEMAWHLAENDGYTAFGVAQGKFTFEEKPPGLERPKTIAELATGYERVHRDAVTWLEKGDFSDMNKTMSFYDGRPLPLSTILWEGLLFHLIHHRGQLAMMARMAGGVPPGMYGPNREEMLKMREAMKAKA